MDHEALIRWQWPDYEVSSILGEGAFGCVYEIAHKSSTDGARYAVKVISFKKALERCRRGGLEEITQYLENCVKDLRREARVMQILKGHPNIVSIEDFAVMREEESDQDYVLIRMELLKSFSLWRNQRGGLTQEDIVCLGIDLCRAVEHCHRNKIIYWDIKLNNIFVNADNHFKLGDFGHVLLAESDQMSHITTVLQNRVPEAYCKELDPSNFESLVKADIYNIGMFLYRLLNSDTFPFLPADRPATSMEWKFALEVRMRGFWPVPPPMHADDALSKIVLKTLANDPEQRYASVRALRKALEALFSSKRAGAREKI